MDVNATLSAVQVLIETVRTDPAVTNLGAISRLNSIASSIDAVQKMYPAQHAPVGPVRRVIVLPTDNNDKGVFALEAMADALGLTVTSVELPDKVPTLLLEQPKAAPTASDIVNDILSEIRAEWPDPSDNDEEVVNLTEKGKLTIGVDMNNAPIYPPETAFGTIESFTPVYKDVEISKKTGKPKRPYVKGGRPGTHYARMKRS